MDQPQDTRNPLEPKPELVSGEAGKAFGKSKKARRTQGRKGLRVALKRLSTIQTVGIALAIAAMSVGTTYFALVKPRQPEPVVPFVVVSPQPTEMAPTPVITQTPQAPALNPVDEVLRWKYETGQMGYLSNPVNHGRDVLASGKTVLYSVAYEGDLRWKFPAPDNGNLTAPIVNVDNNVIVATDRGNVYSLDGWGEVEWEFDAKGGIRGRPAVTKRGYVVVGSRTLYCLYPRGPECWSFSVEGANFGSASPVMANNILVVSAKGVLYSVSYKGELVWELDLELTRSAIPAVGKDGTIFVYGYKDQEMHSISAAGELLWSKNIRGNMQSGVTVMSDGSLLAAGFDAKITRFTADGTVLWRTNAVSSQKHAPLIGSDGLIYLSGHDSVLVLNSDGSKLVRIKLPGGASRGLVQGIAGSIFASSSGGNLLSFKLPQ